MRQVRRIFITGASSGIGQALALQLAQDGHILGLAARRHQKLEAVAAKVKEAGGKALIYPLDVCDRQAQFTAVQAFVKEVGGLDVAIANAGFGLTKPILETTSEEAHELFDVNVFGLLNTLQASAPYLQGGVFVGVSSVVAYALPTGYGVYSATKSAVSALMTILRRETEGQFEVVLINPGETQTEFWQVAEKRSGELLPGGSPVPFKTAETVAAAIVKAIYKPQPSVFMSLSEKLLPLLRGAFPGVLERHFKQFDREMKQKKTHKLTSLSHPQA
ncbi:MAG: SDR family NAD(P)-dependent oxidoreductase [Moorea sp. SIO4A3]|nr:SDR family NAD(P)-dependent oxidoreductase [Moorena sp. SIO4A3]